MRLSTELRRRGGLVRALAAQSGDVAGSVQRLSGPRQAVGIGGDVHIDAADDGDCHLSLFVLPKSLLTISSMSLTRTIDLTRVCRPSPGRKRVGPRAGPSSMQTVMRPRSKENRSGHRR